MALGRHFAISEQHRSRCGPALYRIHTVAHQYVVLLIHRKAFTGVANLHLRFPIPDDLPSGTAKVRCMALSDVETGNVQFGVEWAGLDAEQDASSNDIATNGSEGNQTVTWSSGDDDVYKELVVTLDANSTDPIAAGDRLVMRIVFATASTSAVESVWSYELFWE